MGYLSDGDILTDLLHLEGTLAGLGCSVKPGAGVSVAAGMLEPRVAHAR